MREVSINAASASIEIMTVEITFAIAAHNAAPFIEEALSSILAQSVGSLEAIVVDDASTDETCEIVARFAAQDARIRLLRNQANLGPAAARNAALAIATGRWFAVVDADDAISPERTARLLDLAAVSGADIVADNLQRFDDSSGRDLSCAFGAGASPYGFAIDAADYLRANEMYARRMPLGYLKPMFRKKLLENGGLSYREDLRIGEDFDLCLRCLLSGARYVATSEPTYRYRVRKGSISWRLDIEAVERLIDAYSAAMSHEIRSSDDLRSAGQAYLKSLMRARAYLSLVDAVKSRRWRDAFFALLLRRDLLPLLLNSILAHFIKRFSTATARARGDALSHEIGDRI
jgi:succinoglycan biosynthesis protein ExoO